MSICSNRNDVLSIHSKSKFHEKLSREQKWNLYLIKTKTKPSVDYESVKILSTNICEFKFKKKWQNLQTLHLNFYKINNEAITVRT